MTTGTQCNNHRFGAKALPCTLIVSWLLLLSACGDPPKEATSLETAPSTEISATDSTAGQSEAEVTPKTDNSVSTIIMGSYQTALQKADALRAQLLQFLAQPSAKALEATQAAWHQAHDAYHLADASRQLQLFHPQLDLALAGPPVKHPWHVRLDVHPLIPGYLDGVASHPYSGLIHSEATLSQEHLNNEHQFSDAAYVTLGFHALEFMLTGDSNLSEARHEDYLANEASSKNVKQLVARRHQYVTLLADQIHSDITLGVEAWQSPEGKYLLQWQELDTAEQAQRLNQALEMDKHHAEDGTLSHLPAEVISGRHALLEKLITLLSSSSAS